MILTVWIDRNRYHPESREEENRLIRKVMEELEYGDNASFILDTGRAGESSYPDSTLTVSINRSTGFGGAVWHVGENYPKQGGIYDSVWVSDNPSPPDIDPKVLSDVHVPVFMAPASVITLADLQSVIEEFCHAKTGDRPVCIQWVKGRIGGERAEGQYDLDPKSETSTRAESLLGVLLAHGEAGDLPPGY
ncbi:Imm1 family immunity protein [Kitasatospora sp. NPDC048194]|uniref:Imm1 family immunity protein n=1 Tax=Kitasatospora sp. NPDC048194 TaxID=3364045 RepID=UPI003713C11A